MSLFDIMGKFGELMTPETTQAMAALPERIEQWGAFMTHLVEHNKKLENLLVSSLEKIDVLSTKIDAMQRSIHGDVDQAILYANAAHLGITFEPEGKSDE